MISTRSFVLGALLAIAPTSLWAGVYIETVERNAKTGAEKPSSVMQIQDGRGRIDASSNGRNAAMIFRDNTLYILDAGRKSYMVFDTATVERTASMMKDAMAAMRTQMESMPPEQRAAMENMMKQNGISLPSANSKVPVYDAKATGATETIGGKSCKTFDITRDGVLEQQVCVAPYSSLPGNEEFQALGKQMSALTDKLGETVKQLGLNLMQPANELTQKLGGIPILTRRYSNGVLQPEELQIKTWRKESVAGGKFEIPTGYTKQEMPMPGKPR